MVASPRRCEQGEEAGPVARAGCPCQEACDNKTEEVEYADQAPDKRQEFASNCGLACQQGHGEIYTL